MVAMTNNTGLPWLTVVHRPLAPAQSVIVLSLYRWDADNESSTQHPLSLHPQRLRPLSSVPGRVCSVDILHQLTPWHVLPVVLPCRWDAENDSSTPSTPSVSKPQHSGPLSSAHGLVCSVDILHQLTPWHVLTVVLLCRWDADIDSSTPSTPSVSTPQRLRPLSSALEDRLASASSSEDIPTAQDLQPCANPSALLQTVLQQLQQANGAKRKELDWQMQNQVSLQSSSSAQDPLALHLPHYGVTIFLRVSSSA